MSSKGVIGVSTYKHWHSLHARHGKRSNLLTLKMDPGFLKGGSLQKLKRFLYHYLFTFTLEGTAIFRYKL